MSSLTNFIQAGYHYIEYLRVVKNSSEHTVRNYAIDLNSLRQYIERLELSMEREEELPDKIRIDQSYAERWKERDHIIPLSMIDRQLMRRFIAHLYEMKIGKRSLIRRISSLRSFFKYLIVQGVIRNSPLENVESPKIEKTLPTYLSYREIERFFSIPDTSLYLGFRDRTVMELFYSSGLRVSELVALNREDFDPHQLTIRIQEGKGKKESILPITKNAAGWITDYLNHKERYEKNSAHFAEKDSSAIFLNKWGERITTRSIDRKFSFYLKKSGLSGKITPHTIRHVIATHWLENGMDIKTIQTLLRHSSPATTAIYAQVSQKLKKEVYDETHPRA